MNVRTAVQRDHAFRMLLQKTNTQTHTQTKTNKHTKTTNTQTKTNTKTTNTQTKTNTQTNTQTKNIHTNTQTNNYCLLLAQQIQQPTLCTPLVDFGAAFFRKLWPIRSGIGHRAAITCLNFMSYVM